jgi:phage FluMu protein gp41
MHSREKIVIRYINRPDNDNMDGLIRLFCCAFDFDYEHGMEPLMLKEIVDASFAGDGITSLALKKRISAPRSTVIYHINRFMNVGLIVRRGTRYFLRAQSMVSTMEEIQKDIDGEFNRLSQYAEMLDNIIERDVYGGRKTRRRGR